MADLTGRKAISHERIVDVGSRAVRRVGFDGVKVADVMKAAGMTHGGFYAHFASRDALLSESVQKASADILDTIRHQMKRLTRAGVSPFRAFVELYLDEDNIGDCQQACPVLALGSEMPRQAPDVVDSGRIALGNLQRSILDVLPPGSHADTAWSVAAALLGGMQMARILGDNEQGRGVVAAIRVDLVQRFDTTH